jgi:hypothetical protein
MNWTECERQIRRIVVDLVKGKLDDADLTAIESEIASWIDGNFGLEPDPNLPPGIKHHHEGSLT